ncbi:MAG: hypothetical protein ABIZ04_01895 [Opitutus sp.]
MRTSLRSALIATVLVALPSLAHAHPGHDDHDITWDFTHLISHPFATLGCLAVLGGAVWAVWRLARWSEAGPRDQAR